MGDVRMENTAAAAGTSRAVGGSVNGGRPERNGEGNGIVSEVVDTVKLFNPFTAAKNIFGVYDGPAGEAAKTGAAWTAVGAGCSVLFGFNPAFALAAGAVGGAAAYVILKFAEFYGQHAKI